MPQVRIQSRAMLAAFCLAATLAVGVRGQLFSEAAQSASVFNIQVTGQSSSSGQCTVQNGPSTVAGPIEFVVQNATNATLNFNVPGGNTLQLVSSGSQNSYVTISRDGQQSVTSVQYMAAGTSSGTIDVQMALQNQTGQICALTLRLVPQQSGPFPALGLYEGQGSSINIAPFAPAGINPGRSCAITGQAGEALTGPFNVFVPYGQTVTLTSGSSLFLTTDSTPGVVTSPVNGSSPFQNASFTSYGNGLPTQLMLALNQPQACTVSIYFIPFAGPVLSRSSPSVTSPPPPPPPVAAPVTAATPTATTGGVSNAAAPVAPAPAIAFTLPGLSNLPIYFPAPAAAQLAPAANAATGILAAFGRRLLVA